MADSLITDPMGVQAYLVKLDQLEAVGVDLLQVFQSTFADSTSVTSLVEGLTPGLPCHRSSCGQYRKRRWQQTAAQLFTAGLSVYQEGFLNPLNAGRIEKFANFWDERRYE